MSSWIRARDELLEKIYVLKNNGEMCGRRLCTNIYDNIYTCVVCHAPVCTKCVKDGYGLTKECTCNNLPPEFEDAEPQNQNVHACMVKKNVVDDDILVEVPIEYFLDVCENAESDKMNETCTVKLPGDIVLKQLGLYKVKQLLHNVSERSDRDMQELSRYFIKSYYGMNAAPSLSVSPNLELLDNVDGALQDDILEEQDLEDLADLLVTNSRFVDIILQKVRPDVLSEDSIGNLNTPVKETLAPPHTVPKQTKTKKVTPTNLLELIEETPELAAIEGQIVFHSPEDGFTPVNRVEWLYRRDLVTILADEYIRSLLPDTCLYQFVPKQGAFKLWIKGVGREKAFNTSNRAVWNKRDQLFEVLRYVFKKGLKAPSPPPQSGIGVDNNGELKFLPHYFVVEQGSSPFAKTLFDVLLDRLKFLSNECQLGDSKPLEVWLNAYSQNGKTSKLYKQFLNNEHMTGATLMGLTTPETTKRKAKEPKQKKHKKSGNSNSWLSIE